MRSEAPKRVLLDQPFPRYFVKIVSDIFEVQRKQYALLYFSAVNITVAPGCKGH